jgi:hypothetical protein
MKNAQRFFLVFAALMAQSAVGCLPQDNRPTPASLLVTASGNDAIQHGFDTDDGWHIEFNRFVVSIGHAAFTKTNSCTTYSDGNYERVLDLVQPGEQKVNLIYGIGSCSLEFRVANPNANSLAGAGVTDQDIVFMRTQGKDRFTPAKGQGANGYIAGLARKVDQVKSFTWMFRQNWYYSDCTVSADSSQHALLELNGGDQDSVDLSVHGQDLFQEPNLLNEPRFLFQPIADADSIHGNRDGDVALSELSTVYVTTSYDPSSQGAPAAADAGEPITSDLQEVVYLTLFPNIFYYAQSGLCTAKDTRPGRD